MPADNLISGALRKYQQQLQLASEQVLKSEQVSVGATPKTTIFEQQHLTLYRYTALTKTQQSIPILIVYALVNRPYVLDLQPDRSMVRQLLQLGLDVYLLDWGYADEHDQKKSLASYISEDIHRCVREVCKTSHVDKLHLLGICQGGVFSLCYAALFKQYLRSLITMVTPVDFNPTINPLSHLVQDVDIDRLVACYGNVPGGMLNQMLLMLTPGRNMNRYLDLLDELDKPERAIEFLRMEKWLFDCPDQAGVAFGQFVTDFFKSNKLIKNEIRLNSQVVKLANIKQPVLNIYALQDHLVPPASTLPLQTYIGTRQYEDYAYDGGHIGIYVSRKAQMRVANKIAAWTAAVA